MKFVHALAIAMLFCGPQIAQAMSADEVVSKHCVACHDAGLGGAPKMDDRAAWEPRIATGIDAMTATVLSGKGACGSCSEEDIRAAIGVMIAPLQ